MNEINTTLIIIALEVIVVCIGLGVSLLWFANKSKKRTVTAVEKLIGTLKNRERERRVQIHQLMQKVYNIEGDELATIGEVVLTKEKDFYKYFIEVILKRNPSSISSFYQSLEELTETYYQFAGESQPQVANESPSDEVLSAENARLSEQLEATRNALNSVFGDYSAIKGFKFGDPSKMSVKEITGLIDVLNGGKKSENSDDSKDAQESDATVDGAADEPLQDADDSEPEAMSASAAQMSTEELGEDTEAQADSDDDSAEDDTITEQETAAEADLEPESEEEPEPEPEEEPEDHHGNLLNDAIAEATGGADEDAAQLAAELDQFLNQVDSEEAQDADRAP